MKLGDLDGVEAVAFDIDGTLYEDWKLNIRMPLYLLLHLKHFLAYNKIRKLIRINNESGDFFAIQNRYMAKELKITEEQAAALLDKMIYQGLKKKFRQITPCKGAFQCLKSLKDKGIKIALLSDFPPEQKGDVWGMAAFADVILGSENCGALKPSSIPFLEMAKQLGTEPSKILYVGNSYKYDVMGGKNCGMKTAWFASKRKIKKLADNCEKPDITFSSYGEFCQKLEI